MSAAAHISETRHGHILAELASLGLTLARDLHARALAAETTEEAAKLATAFHRISRGVRQSLALEAKLEREQQAHDLQHAPLREKARLARVSRRHTQVFRTVERLIWNEAEDQEIAGYMVDDLRDLLDSEALDEDFLAEPLAQQIDRIRARFDLIGAEPDPAPETVGDTVTDAFEASKDLWGSPPPANP
jgi:hypothetical protein